MASSTPKHLCSKCTKNGAIASCGGCEQWLCGKHFKEHRQELAEQLDTIVQEYDLLQRDSLKEKDLQSLLMRINDWEKEAVEKIKSTAQKARVDLQTYCDQHTRQFKSSLDQMHTNIQSSQESDDYTEVDFKKWMEQLNEFRTMLENTCLVDLDDGDEGSSAIHMIQVKQISKTSRLIESPNKTIAINEPTLPLRTRRILDLGQLDAPIRTIRRERSSSSAMCTNDQFMLIHNISNLCLLNTRMETVRQTAWKHQSVNDMCWSKKLKKFFLVTNAAVYMLDPQTMTYEQTHEGIYGNCTCSPTVLYLTLQPGYEVLAHDLSALHSSKSIFKSPQKELIEGIAYHADKLAIISNTRSGTEPHVTILSAITYVHLQFLTITDALGYNHCGISSLTSSGWLVKDPSMYNLFHIVEDGTLRMTADYKYGHPYNAIRFDSNYLAVITGESYNLHKLKYVSPEELSPPAKPFISRAQLSQSLKAAWESQRSASN